MNASRSAFFVIDIQKDLAHDPKTRIPDAERIIYAGENILKFLRGITTFPKPLIVFVQHEEMPDKGPLVKGTEPWKLCFENDPRDTFKSNPNLADYLKSEGIEQIIAFGIQSECCVLETCKGALQAGFGVTLLNGAHSTYNSTEKSALQIEQDVEEELVALGASVRPWRHVISQ
ncbi:KGD2-2-oxoglutarate dehydrogenase complex E2 component [Fusarium heterosporum]|uniref:KGD2-2-oxoglutarate dehydrogenase complex E2 component n=1 Tax=Fusarium heterosporum TaxID=42747 RepID=A0A8H5X0M9_FUSHE|nr:KGD2-2-oxoglutarate dehydrogenase complex E2 component [Fusarium heterosporum]